MKQYLLFGGDEYYPGGGWEDYQSDHDTADEARQAAKTIFKDTYRWWHIVDIKTMKMTHE